MTNTPILRCTICRATDNPTIEHIVPQTLLRSRFGLDPHHEDLARFRTVLCDAHNQATSALHGRTEMMELIDAGAPITTKALTDLADWAVWVTLLLGLSRGDGVLRSEEARRLLAERFGGNAGGLPKGIRVYATLVDEYITDTEFVSHMVGVEHDSRIVRDHAGAAVGFNVIEGPITVSESIGLGKVAILVLPRSFSSGRDHNARLDEAARSVGLERIHPLGPDLPDLVPRSVDMKAVSELFMPPPFGRDTSLLPGPLRAVAQLLTPVQSTSGGSADDFEI